MQPTEDRIQNLQRLLNATRTAKSKKAQKEHKQRTLETIRQLTGRTTLPTSNLEQMAIELMLAGNDKTQIAQILAIREKLTPSQQRELEKILQRLF